MSFSQFSVSFQWKIPEGNFEVEGIRRIRSWMHTSGISSEQAFERLCAGDGYTLSKRRFIDEITKQKGMYFTAPELELLFKHMDQNNDNRIDMKEWTDQIYEDASNPIQLIREVIQSNAISSEELLHKMHLRIWDDALDITKFMYAVRKLDPTLTDAQLRSMAQQMKNRDGKVEIMMMLQNLCGNEFETVDFRNRIFK